MTLSVAGIGYENVTYYELDKKGVLGNKVEELGKEIGPISITVEGLFDLDKEEKILPPEIIEATHEYQSLFRFISFTVGSAITNPKDPNGPAIRAYKTKEHSQALLLAELVSGWLGGSYIIVARHNRHERYSQTQKPVYYIWSEGGRHYIEPDKKNLRVQNILRNFLR